MWPATIQASSFKATGGRITIDDSNCSRQRILESTRPPHVTRVNNTVAAQGYGSPTVTASKLLAKANIRAEVDRRLAELKTSRTADTQEILEHLTSVVRGELTEEIVTNSGKKLTVKVSERDRLKAAEMLLKVGGAFRECVEVKVDVCAQFATAVEEVWRRVDSAD